MADIFADRLHLLPTSYVDFIEHRGGWEGDLGGELGYVVLWERELLQEQYEGYEVAKNLSDRWFPFGSNCGGEMLCFDLIAGTDQVFWVPFIGMSDEDAMPRRETFREIAAAIPKHVE